MPDHALNRAWSEKPSCPPGWVSFRCQLSEYDSCDGDGSTFEDPFNADKLEKPSHQSGDQLAAERATFPSTFGLNGIPPKTRQVPLGVYKCATNTSGDDQIVLTEFSETRKKHPVRLFFNHAPGHHRRQIIHSLSPYGRMVRVCANPI